jgi:regulation of enolase protein 1 (concanavalin A-like superfamily)
MLPMLTLSWILAGSNPATLPDHLHLSAPKGSDYYGVGADANLTAPTVMVPVSGDFVFAARVRVHFTNDYDGAALLVRADAAHWAKLLVERSKPGMEGVTSSVVRGDSDDAYHVFFGPGEDTAWLKITRKGQRYGFYTSKDGQTWTIARDFTLSDTSSVTVGVEAQSPLGPEFSADFDHVRLESKTATDYWQGE